MRGMPAIYLLLIADALIEITGALRSQQPNVVKAHAVC